MTTRIQDPISTISLTARVQSAIPDVVESIRRDLRELSAKELMDRMAEAGFTAKISTGLSSAAKKREIGQLLTSLQTLPQNAQDTLAGFGGLPNDLMNHPGTRLASNRYDLGVVIEERHADRGGRKMTGLVFNALFPRQIMPWERHSRSAGGHAELERNVKGGFNVDFGKATVVGTPAFRPEKMSIEQIIDEKIDCGRFPRGNRQERLDVLKAQGYDVKAQRSVLEVDLSDRSSQLVFFKLAGERSNAPLTKDEIKTAKRLGYDLSAYEALTADEKKNPAKVAEATAYLPRDFGIGCVDSCVDFGDMLAGRPILARKPVINVYHPVPGTAVEIGVTLTNSAYFASVYPKPVVRQGDETITWRMKSGGLSGELFDPQNEKRYPYLYWEAVQNGTWKIDRSQAYCVRGADAAEFLESACQAFAFNAKETTDFVTYWLTALEGNEYNVVQFLGTAEYERFAQMAISPTPDQVTRVFMIFERSSIPVQTGAPELVQVTRHAGFVVTEWGGCNLDETRRIVR